MANDAQAKATELLGLFNASGPDTLRFTSWYAGLSAEQQDAVASYLQGQARSGQTYTVGGAVNWLKGLAALPGLIQPDTGVDIDRLMQDVQQNVPEVTATPPPPQAGDATPTLLGASAYPSQTSPDTKDSAAGQLLDPSKPGSPGSQAGGLESFGLQSGGQSLASTPTDAPEAGAASTPSSTPVADQLGQITAQTPATITRLGAHGPSISAEDLAAVMGLTTAQIQQEYALYAVVAEQNGLPISFDQWTNKQLGLVIGQMGPAVQQIAQQYQDQYGVPMPPDLLASVTHQLMTAPQETKDNIMSVFSAPLKAGQIYPDILSAAPFVATTIANYQTNHPTTQSKEDALIAQYTQTFGQAPPAGWAAQHIGDSPAVLADVFNNTEMPGTHLTLGQYNASVSTAVSLWRKNFPGATPSLADIQKIATFKDMEQAQEWVNTLPSHINGMNIGTYGNVLAASTKIRSELWNLPSDHAFTTEVANALSTSPAPTPGTTPAQPQPPPQGAGTQPTQLQRIGPAYG